MIKARYYGKRIGRYVYKTFKSNASMMRAKRGLKRVGCSLNPIKVYNSYPKKRKRKSYAKYKRFR